DSVRFRKRLSHPHFQYIMFSKSCMISEYSAFWRCVQAACTYLVTQLCKMLVLATFFPTSESTADSLDVFAEFLKSTVDVADLFGLYLTMSKIPGKGELKVLVAGLGYARSSVAMTTRHIVEINFASIEMAEEFGKMKCGINTNLIESCHFRALPWFFRSNVLHQKSLLLVAMLFILLQYTRSLDYFSIT
ncbi:Hypothetical predicted protein, partial [Paramuricea clavata]